MKILLLIMTIGHGADLGSSALAFSVGAGEANPLVASTDTLPFVVQGVAVAGTEAVLLHRLHRKHPKLAKGLAITQIIVSAYVTSHNMRVYDAQRRLNGR